jgi:predicted nucleotidyltransferase
MSKISDALFSKSTKAILTNIFMRPEGMHLRGLMQHTGLGSASAQRELGRLTDAGVLVKEEVGKLLLYKANQHSPIYPELSAILRKIEGVAALLKEVLSPFQDRILRAFIYGSVAKSEDTAASDIDLFVLADEIGGADLYPMLVELERQLGRKVSMTVFRPSEFRRKLEAKNHFLVSVMEGPKIELFGEPDAQ